VTLANPRTGELATPETTVEDLRMWEAMLDDMIGPLVRSREGIRRAIADRTDSPALPSRKYRTATQEKLTLCPRCRRKYGVQETTADAVAVTGGGVTARVTLPCSCPNQDTLLASCPVHGGAKKVRA
jgi:hypothetical protein